MYYILFIEILLYYPDILISILLRIRNALLYLDPKSFENFLSKIHPRCHVSIANTIHVSVINAFTLNTKRLFRQTESRYSINFLRKRHSSQYVRRSLIREKSLLPSNYPSLSSVDRICNRISILHRTRNEKRVDGRKIGFSKATVDGYWPIEASTGRRRMAARM